MDDKKVLGISIIWFIVSIISGFILEYFIKISHEYLGHLTSEDNDFNMYQVTGMLLKSFVIFFVLLNACLITLFIIKNHSSALKWNKNLISSLRTILYFIMIAIILGFLIFEKQGVYFYSYYFNYSIFKITLVLGLALGIIGFSYNELILKKT
jgi:hypothetical protein